MITHHRNVPIRSAIAIAHFSLFKLTIRQCKSTLMLLRRREASARAASAARGEWRNRNKSNNQLLHMLDFSLLVPYFYTVVLVDQRRDIKVNAFAREQPIIHYNNNQPGPYHIIADWTITSTIFCCIQTSQQRQYYIKTYKILYICKIIMRKH